MLKMMVVVMMIGACRGPLAPGETRCSTFHGDYFSSTRCETGQATQQPTESDATRHPGGPNWWCATSDLEVGICARSIDACQRRVASLDAHGHPFTPCAAFAAAACLKYETAQGVGMDCAPTMEICRSSADYIRNNQPDVQVAGGCVVVE